MKTQDNTPKHTPGPWKYRISTPAEENKKWGKNCGANCHIFAEIPGKFLLGCPDTKTIVIPIHWRDEADNDEEIANIKLIAAAPEMLDELKRIDKIFEQMPCKPSDWERLKEVIKKAAGEQ